ncbi:MAG: diaminopimelate epimerase [Propionibacteriaceae bacterium]|nr:diaminopimelate epimerase [Propionibacteriaceae bacterium]
MSPLAFAKGHGTENDFVVIRDRQNMVPPTPELVRQICDRRTGVGADGILRAVKAQYIPEWQGDPDVWFMDYWNNDGSIAEMCGNGLRVFVRYLIEEDLVPRMEAAIGTRAGLRTVWEQPSGALRAEMGSAVVGQQTWVGVGDRRFDATSVNVGNPHVVVILPSDVALNDLDLQQAPSIDQQCMPQGANAEFVHITGPNQFTMRVFERGVGETRSCGTGVVAAAAAVRNATATSDVFNVQVPGGRLRVEFSGGQAYLTGPAIIVARGNLTLPD